jgi:hypothetical protein
MFVYERESDSTVVVGAGIPLAWAVADAGAGVNGIHTSAGALGFTVRASGDSVTVQLSADASGFRIPRGGIVVLPPTPKPPRRAWIDGRAAPLTREGGVILRKLPATVVIR